MELQNYINIIYDKLAILSTEIRLRGKFNMYDIHIVAETFFAELMNLIFGYQLKNINLYEHNAKAIDLIDTENKIIVQVSSDNSRGKVQSSLSGIKEEYKQNNYHFIFISISEEVTKLKEKSFEIPEGIIFDPKNDCFDNKSLITHIESKGIECIKRVSDYLNKTVVYTGSKSVVPDFKFNPVQNLIARDTAVDNLHNFVNKNQFTNLCGLGGSGKTSLVNLFVAKYASEYNQIAYIVVNNSIKDDFILQIDETIHLYKTEDNATERINKIEELATKEQIQYKEKNKDKYKSIIDYLEFNYQSNKPNLLIIDINNAPKDETEKFGNDLVTRTQPFNKIYPYGWKYLIVSREKIHSGIEELNLNGKENENNAFLRELFLDNAGQENYKSFSDNDFVELFKTIFYSPLITEQLGRFLRNKEPYSLQEIFVLLDKDRFKNKERFGITSHNRHDEEEKTIIGFLRNIVVLDNFSEDEQKLFRHFILWPTDYIPRNVVAGLLEGLFESEDDFDEALDNLIERKIVACQKNNNIREYKLHGLVAKSLRCQIEVSEENYLEYLNNIRKIMKYQEDEFMFFGECIGYSLSEYNLTQDEDILETIALRLGDCIVYNSRIKLLNTLVEIYKQKSKKYSKYNDLAQVVELFIKSITADWKMDKFSSLEYNKQICIKQKDLFSNSEDEKLHWEARFFYYEAEQQTEFKNYRKAKECYQKAIQILESISNNNQKYNDFLAAAYNSFALLLYKEHLDYSSAKNNFINAIEIWKKIGNNYEHQENLARVYVNLAILEKEQFQDYTSALDNYNSAIEIREKLPKNNLEYQIRLASSYNSLAMLQKKNLQNYASALENFHKAIEIRKNLPPKNLEYQNSLATSYHNLANLLKDQLFDYYSAKEYYTKAIDIRKNNPKDNPKYQYLLAISYFDLANLFFYNLQDYQSAQLNYTQAIDITENHQNDNTELRHEFASAYNKLAYCYDKLNNYDDAIKSITAAIEIVANLKEKDSKYLIEWLNYRHSMAEIKINNGKDLDEVKTELLEMKSIVQNYLNDNPNNEKAKKNITDIDSLLSKLDQ